MQNINVILFVALLVVLTVVAITIYFVILKKVKTDSLKALIYLFVILFGVGLPLYIFSRIFVAYKVAENDRFLAFMFWALSSLLYMIWKRRRKN